MKRTWLVTTGLILIVLASFAVGCNAGTANAPGEVSLGNIILSQQNTGIWVTGQGKVSAVPDIATLSLGVEAQAKTVAEAQQQASTAMDAVRTALTRNGIADNDIKTQNFAIYAVTQWMDNKETLIGYRVTNTMTVKIRKVSDTGAIIDAAAKAGGDYIRVSNINFTFADPSPYYSQAREKAMADAQAKAKQLATLAGVSLGKPVYVNETSTSLPIPIDYIRGGGAIPAPSPTTPISPGEIDIQLSVQVVYSIK